MQVRSRRCSIVAVMVAARVYGFAPEEMAVVGGALRQSGWEVVEEELAGALPADMDRRMALVPAPSLVVAAIRAGGDVSVLSRCVRVARTHLYAAGVADEVGRAAASGIALELRGCIFFLPPEGAEVVRLFHDCRTMARALEARKHLARGMRRQVLRIELETGDVHVAEVAWYLTDRMTDGGFCDSPESRQRMELAVEEALLNAVEHGNLELDSGLRPADATGRDLYEELRRARIADPRYASRKVRITLRLADERAVLEVTDEGAGILSGARIGPVPGVGTGPADIGGRGMDLIRRAFDSMECEGSTLILRRRKEPGDGAEHPQAG